eukprot:4513560-Lingulodinium_polyedra.AAC.1
MDGARRGHRGHALREALSQSSTHPLPQYSITEDRPYATGWCPLAACSLNDARQRCYDTAMLRRACRGP